MTIPTTQTGSMETLSNDELRTIASSTTRPFSERWAALQLFERRMNEQAPATLTHLDRAIAACEELITGPYEEGAAECVKVLRSMRDNRSRSIEKSNQINQVLSDMEALSPEELRAELDKHKGGLRLELPEGFAQPASTSSLPILSIDELSAFNRFCECSEDSESGGYDVDKEMMKRLADIGVVNSLGFGRYQTTVFGDFVRSSHSNLANKSTTNPSKLSVCVDANDQFITVSVFMKHANISTKLYSQKHALMRETAGLVELPAEIFTNPDVPSAELRSILIELIKTQRQLIDANAELAMLRIAENPLEETIPQLDPYTYKRNTCKCHPDTCNCDPWAVFSPNGNRLCTVFDEPRAQRLVAELNRDSGRSN